MKNNKEILFEKFEIIDCLKKDENYGVYVANHVFLSKKILLKTLNTKTNGDKEKAERFKREAKILAKLDHPNIIKVLDFGTFNYYFYISFEYFESRNLRYFICENNLTIEEKKNLVHQLLEGLSYAHANDVIHRDIKPENILVNDQMKLKITDFGLAFSPNENLVTRQYSVLGTPSYMSPEQITGEPIKRQSDLFSTGIVIYELFSGNNPFLGKDAGESINRIINFKEEEIFYDRNKIPAEIENVIRELIHKKNNKRISSASDALERMGFKHTEEFSKRIKTKTSKGKIIAAITGVLILFLVLFMIYNFQKTSQQNSTGIDTVQTKSNKSDAAIGNSKTTVNNNKEKDKTENQNTTAEHVASNIHETKVNKEKNGLDNKVGTVDNTQAEKADNSSKDITKIKFGKLYVECFPWAKVYIDSEYMETTPLKNNLIIPSGYHDVELKNIHYPVYEDTILIRPDTLFKLQVNLDTLFGYLKCDIYPWADIYLKDKKIAQTPLTSPIKIIPGNYILTLKGPATMQKQFNIKIFRSDTVVINYDFRKMK
jgi:eukaryotic-like serine/threonine-protein kinase